MFKSNSAINNLAYVLAEKAHRLVVNAFRTGPLCILIGFVSKEETLFQFVRPRPNQRRPGICLILGHRLLDAFFNQLAGLRRRVRNGRTTTQAGLDRGCHDLRNELFGLAASRIFTAEENERQPERV